MKKLSTKNLKKADYAYIFESHGYFYPKALYQILDKGLRAKVSMKKFKINDKLFDYGTIMVPVHNQKLNSNDIYKLLTEVSIESELNIYETNTVLLSKELI